MEPTTLLSPLQLKEHRFNTVLLKAIKEGSINAEPSFVPTIWFEKVPGHSNQWKLILTLRLGSANSERPFAYEAELQVQGLVQINAGFVKENAEQLALVNGLSMLYSAAREMVLNISARSAYGTMTLPTLSFVSIVKEAISQKKAAAVKRQESAKT